MLPRIILALAILAINAPAPAKENPPRRTTTLYRISQVAVIGAAVADTASSWNKYEANPVLGRQKFGTRQAAIKFSITGGSLAAGEILTHRRSHGRADKVLVITNFAVAAFNGCLAARNYRINGATP